MICRRGSLRRGGASASSGGGGEEDISLRSLFGTILSSSIGILWGNFCNIEVRIWCLRRPCSSSGC